LVLRICSRARILRTRLITQRAILWRLRSSLQQQLLQSKTLLNLACAGKIRTKKRRILQLPTHLSAPSSTARRYLAQAGGRIDPQPIHACKHPKHSRVLEGQAAERRERTGKTVDASKKAIQRASELMQQSDNLMNRVRKSPKA
jgi:hypothetical protein